MSKILAKTVKKGMLLTAIVTIIIVASIVIGAIFGFNGLVSDAKTLTVSIDGGVAYETRLEELQAECEKEFEDLNAKYVIKSELSVASQELVFTFNKKADLTAVKAALTTKFENGWKDAIITVSTANEDVIGTMPYLYILLACLGCALFSALAFGYATLRYKWHVGAIVGIATAVSMMLTTAIIVLTRVLVTPTVGCAIAVSGMLTAVLAMLTANNLKSASNEENAEEKSAEEKVLSAIPVKETLFVCAGLGIAVLLVGILGQTEIAWFAVSALIAIVVSAFIALMFAPAIYLPLKVWVDARPTKNAYVGAKKAVKEVEVKAEESVKADDEE